MPVAGRALPEFGPALCALGVGGPWERKVWSVTALQAFLFGKGPRPPGIGGRSITMRGPERSFSSSHTTEKGLKGRKRLVGCGRDESEGKNGGRHTAPQRGVLGRVYEEFETSQKKALRLGLSYITYFDKITSEIVFPGNRKFV